LEFRAGCAKAALSSGCKPHPDSMIKARIADWGVTVLALSPADFGKLIADDTEKWGKVVKFANIKPE
jgi:hypothetical protein